MNEPEQQPVLFKILDKAYHVNCTEDEREALIASANYLDEKMRTIRDSGKVVGTDRIAVMAALNISHDLLLCHAGIDASDATASGKIREINSKVEKALERNR